VKISTINRFFNIAFGALAMIAVAMLSAYLAMRVAIHGREVEVPSLAGLSVADAVKKANHVGLGLNIQNRFYSAKVAPGTVLSQSPAPGMVVRREWAIRITESLGPQHVSIPSLTGQAERPATLAIRRLALELGTVAHIPSAGPSGIVLAQTPTASTTPADSPRISLLISAPLPVEASHSASSLASADSGVVVDPSAEVDPDLTAVIMPSLAGLTLSQAVTRASAAGLHVVSVEDQNAPAPAPAASPAVGTAVQAVVPAPASPNSGTVVSQYPQAGHRATKGDPVKITLGY
jgi:beta-lactam-binding protein with PASTA domain